MTRRLVRFLVPAALGALVAVQWPEIVRYFKIELMSSGDGHPQMVPAGGQHKYPDHDATPDGTGEFGSAARGGPA